MTPHDDKRDGGWPQNFINERGSMACFKIRPAEPWARGCHAVTGPRVRVPSAITSSAVAGLRTVAKVTLHQGAVEVRLQSAPSSRGAPAAVGTAIPAQPPPGPPGRTCDQRFCAQAGRQPCFPPRSDLAPLPRLPDSRGRPGRPVRPPATQQEGGSGTAGAERPDAVSESQAHRTACCAVSLVTGAERPAGGVTGRACGGRSHPFALLGATYTGVFAL